MDEKEINKEGSSVIVTNTGKEVVVPKDEKKWLDYLVIAGLVFLASLVRAVAAYCFIAPNGFAIGGIGGIVVMIKYFFPNFAYMGYINIVLNIPLLVLAYFFLSKKYCFLTTAFAVVNSLLLLIIEYIDEQTGGALKYIEPAGSTPLLPAIYGGVMCGFALALMIKAGASTGGTDIVGSIIQKKRPDIGVSWFIFAIDAVIVIVSFFVYEDGFTAVLLALIETFAGATITDKMGKGSKSAIKAEIVTDHAEEICAEILEKLDRGATICDGVGMYTGENHKIVHCVIRNRQVGDLQKILKKYPNTFSYIMPANEVYGLLKK